MKLYESYYMIVYAFQRHLVYAFQRRFFPSVCVSALRKLLKIKIFCVLCHLFDECMRFSVDNSGKSQGFTQAA